MKIGMVGVGMMGHGIASNLVKHGHDLAVLEHPGNQPLDALKAAGVAGVHGAKALAARVDVVILVVTGSPQVEAVLTGPDGILQGLRPGSIVIDCSTAIPSSTVRMAQAVQAAGSRFLDAPMTRTPKEAAEGRLNLLVGGDGGAAGSLQAGAAVLRREHHPRGPGGRRPWHEAAAQLRVAGHGHAAGRSSGLRPAQRRGGRRLRRGAGQRGGGGGIALERIKPYLLAKDTGGLRFSIANACKDLGYYQQMASDTQASRDVANAVLGTLQGALERAGPEALVPELAGLLARD